MEVWKLIEGFPGYEVSNVGRVQSFRRGKPKILGQYPNKKGYLSLVLYSEGSPYTRRAHRLVAEAFVSNPLNLPQVNHEDGNKTNNNDWNLKWTDQMGNMKHASENGLRPHGEGHQDAKVNKEAVLHMIKLRHEDKMPVGEISRIFGLSPSHTSRLTRGIYWKHLKEEKQQLLKKWSEKEEV
jgi:hypothetical protein